MQGKRRGDGGRDTMMSNDEESVIRPNSGPNFP